MSSLSPGVMQSHLNSRVMKEPSSERQARQTEIKGETGLTKKLKDKRNHEKSGTAFLSLTQGRTGEKGGETK